MNSLNLVVKYQFAGDAQSQITGAARMVIDGSGKLKLYGPQGQVEYINVNNLTALSLERIYPIDIANVA